MSNYIISNGNNLNIKNHNNSTLANTLTYPATFAKTQTNSPMSSTNNITKTQTNSPMSSTNNKQNNRFKNNNR
jgi:hypothetical protein